MRTRLTERTVEDLVAATCGIKAGERERHTLRQALYGLVMLAKAEQMYEFKRNIKQASAAASAQQSRRRTKAILQQIAERSRGRQLGLAFDQSERRE